MAKAKRLWPQRADWEVPEVEVFMFPRHEMLGTGLRAGSNYGAITVQFCNINSSGEWKGFMARYNACQETAFADLQLRAQYHKEGRDDDGDIYGFTFEYHGVNLKNAEIAVFYGKLLGHVEKEMALLSDAYGHPATFADYVVRIANILGVVGVALPEGETVNAWNQRYRTIGGNQFVHRRVQELELEAKKACEPKEVSYA